jgi:hypothetical protein
VLVRQHTVAKQRSPANGAQGASVPSGSMTPQFAVEAGGVIVKSSARRGRRNKPRHNNGGDNGGDGGGGGSGSGDGVLELSRKLPALVARTAAAPSEISEAATAAPAAAARAAATATAGAPAAVLTMTPLQKRMGSRTEELGGAFAQLDLSSEEGWAQTGVGRFFVARAAAETCTSTALLTLNANTVICQSWPPAGVDPLHTGGLAECLAATPGAFARKVTGATMCCARGQHFRLDTGDPATAATAGSRFVVSGARARGRTVRPDRRAPAAREAACKNAYRSCYKQCGGRSRTKDTNTFRGFAHQSNE